MKVCTVSALFPYLASFEMTGDKLLKMADDLECYYQTFDECFVRSEGWAMVRRYARGQLGPIERKSLEPIQRGYWEN